MKFTSPMCWLFIAVLALVVAIGGVVAALMFQSAEPMSGDVHNRVIVSPRVFYQFLSLLVAFCIANIALAGSAWIYFVAQNKERVTYFALFLSLFLSVPGWLYIVYLIMS